MKKYKYNVFIDKACKLPQNWETHNEEVSVVSVIQNDFLINPEYMKCILFNTAKYKVMHLETQNIGCAYAYRIPGDDSGKRQWVMEDKSWPWAPRGTQGMSITFLLPSWDICTGTREHTQQLHHLISGFVAWRGGVGEWRRAVAY